MKRLLYITLSCIVLLTSVGCTQKTETTQTPDQTDIQDDIQEAANTINDSDKTVSEVSSEAPENTTTTTPYAESAPEIESAFSQIDINLINQDNSLLHDQLHELFENHETYEGKVVRVSGLFNIAANEGNKDTTNSYVDDYYYLCVIQDDAGCCSQYLEFVWAGDFTYPQDYPALYSPITVTGVFHTYEEDGDPYHQLLFAELDF